MIRQEGPFEGTGADIIARKDDAVPETDALASDLLDSLVDLAKGQGRSANTVFGVRGTAAAGGDITNDDIALLRPDTRMLPSVTASPPAAKAMLGPMRERRTVVQAIPPGGQPQRPCYRVHSASASGSSHRTSANCPNQTATASDTIPIERRATEHRRPAVSSPEACPTPADRVRGTGPATADVRQPLTAR